MADRIIKGDSGNDVVIQNNAGSRKIEVTNSGDVEVTGDVKTTTVKATNLKANDGTASLEIADSTGDVGFSGNTNLKIKLPSAGGIYESDGSTEILTESSGVVTLKNTVLDSTVTGSTGMINSTSIIKMGLDTNSTLNIDDGSSGITIFTTASDSATGTQNSITTVTGRTYFILFSCYVSLSRIAYPIAERDGKIALYKGTANMARGTRSDSWSGTNTLLMESLLGRVAVATADTARESNVLVTIQGNFYESSGGTFYIFAAGSGINDNVRMSTQLSVPRPGYFTIMEIIGNKLTDIT